MFGGSLLGLEGSQGTTRRGLQHPVVIIAEAKLWEEPKSFASCSENLCSVSVETKKTEHIKGQGA